MTMRPKVVVTHCVHSDTLELLSEHCAVWANPARESLSSEEVVRRARDAHALMTFMPDFVDEQFLRECPRLRVIGCALKGYDNYDVDACTRRGVWLTIVPDLLTIPTAELAVGLMIGLGRNVLCGDSLVRSGRFRGWRPRLYGAGLSGMTAGIIGLGAVGRALAERLRAFGMRVLYTDSAPRAPDEAAQSGLEQVPLRELLGASDYVVPLVPLRPDTLHLIDSDALEAMKRGALLVNVGRGSVVDEEAVAAALSNGTLAGYAADVFEFEDWARAGRPRAIPRALLEQPARTLFTPHLGSAVAEVRRKIELEAAHNILEALAGNVPPGAVNRLEECAVKPI